MMGLLGASRRAAISSMMQMIAAVGGARFQFPTKAAGGRAERCHRPIPKYLQMYSNTLYKYI